MVYTFESCFASQIEDFIAQKNALGFGYLESSRLLRDFDRFCLTHFPEENSLTKELCLAWATKKDTEGNNTFRNRMMPVREFARYLNRSGEAAYILPPNISRKDASYAPYIYTEAEILAIWDVFDHLKPRSGFPVRQFVIPAMIKLMYCCGLRPAEARRLRVNDVDLDIGRLNIMESKQHRSRIVMMTDDVTQMLSDCNAIVASVIVGIATQVRLHSFFALCGLHIQWPPQSKLILALAPHCGFVHLEPCSVYFPQIGHFLPFPPFPPLVGTTIS